MDADALHLFGLACMPADVLACRCVADGFDADRGRWVCK